MAAPITPKALPTSEIQRMWREYRDRGLGPDSTYTLLAPLASPEASLWMHLEATR